MLYTALILWISCLQAVLGQASEAYNEVLKFRPLPRNSLLASFEFNIVSSPVQLKYHGEDSRQTWDGHEHYELFPRVLGPIVEASNTRELHLRFSQGWYDTESWGRLPFNGSKSGGTGVEIWAVIEAPDLSAAKADWTKLTNALSGLFCASFNFINDPITTSPRLQFEGKKTGYMANLGNSLFLLRAVLPSEPICTENLTPMLRLLPTRGKRGISSLLDGHKVFDSLWHSMSIDLVTKCDDSYSNCALHMDQTIISAIDIIRSLRRIEEGGIPKPTPGEKLRCDDSRYHDIWECFPLGDPENLSYDIQSIFGRSIQGAAFEDSSISTDVSFEADPSVWNIEAISNHSGQEKRTGLTKAGKLSQINYKIADQKEYNFNFTTANSTLTSPLPPPPLHVYRSLTGYSQDKGGIRVSFTNLNSNDVRFIYFESLPWFMRVYLSTFRIELQNTTGTYIVKDEKEFIKNSYFKPAIDRKRPSQLELFITVPPESSLIINYDFDKSLLLYAEYPPDANHGFDVEPAAISVIGDDNEIFYEMHTTSLLLTLPTPDFSMPYNVIILTCTVMSLAFGSIFNLLTKKVITEEELEKLSAEGKLAKIVNLVKRKLGKR